MSQSDRTGVIVSALGRQLAADFGRGFDEKPLRHMIRFAKAFPDETIVSALRRQLMWTHFKRLIYVEDPLKRDFYAEMCRIEKWNTPTLEKKVGSILFEPPRQACLSRKPTLTRRCRPASPRQCFFLSSHPHDFTALHAGLLRLHDLQPRDGILGRHAVGLPA
jgi:hypothetical protein